MDQFCIDSQIWCSQSDCISLGPYFSESSVQNCPIGFWQRNFTLIYLQFLFSTSDQSLNQTCSLMIALQTWCVDHRQILIIWKIQGSKVGPNALIFRLSYMITKVAFLHLGPNLMGSFANPQICEPYDLRYPNVMMFALRSKSVHIFTDNPLGFQSRVF